MNFGKKTHQLRQDHAFLRLTFHEVKPSQGSVLPAPKDRAAYEAEDLDKYDNWIASSFMDVRKAMDDAKTAYADDLRKEIKNTALKYVPAIIGSMAAFTLLLAFLTFLLNFSTLRLAIPSDPVELRARSLVEELQKKSEQLKGGQRSIKDRQRRTQATEPASEATNRGAKVQAGQDRNDSVAVAVESIRVP